MVLIRPVEVADRLYWATYMGRYVAAIDRYYHTIEMFKTTSPY